MLRMERSRLRTSEYDSQASVLLLAGLNGEATRRHLFGKFKRYGYILAIELEGGGGRDGGERTAKVHFDTAESAERARRATVWEHLVNRSDLIIL